MSGDHTRFSFDAHNGFSGLWQQQGRVSLEADFNEFEQILDRLRRVSTCDTVGVGVVPVNTPDGFEIDVDGDALTIGVGRAYVDGIQVECFGTGGVRFDGHVGNEHGDTPLYLLYPSTDELHEPDPPSLADHQPFGYPEMNVITDDAPHLVYLDMWQREVTAYEHPALREPALGGPDTTTRVQTAWQAKVLGMDPNEPADCGVPVDGWDSIIEPSTGRLSVTVDPAPVEPPPCEVPAKAGYVGLENRLYRVEIHESGQLDNPDSPPQFKWSRDNASLVATVTKITRVGSGCTITVSSTGRDEFLRFEKGQHIELLDDWVEFGIRDHDLGGDLAKIVVEVNHETGEITVDKDLSGFEVKNERHPRIRRWDIAKEGDEALRTATIGTKFALGDGIYVEFGPKDSRLRAGDYWVFAARTATGDSLPEEINEAPPNGVLHHFIKLAVIKPGEPPEVLSDCRVMWPGSGEGCGCDFCVTVESHTSGALTIQKAIDNAIAAGGGTVCLGIGEYTLNTGLIVQNALSLRIRGDGPGTVLLADLQDSALSITDSLGVEINNLTLITFGERAEQASAVEVVNATLVTLNDLLVVENLPAVIEAAQTGEADQSHGPAIRLRGLVVRTTITDCGLVGGEGVGDYRPSAAPAALEDETALFAISVDIKANTILGMVSGVALKSEGSQFVDRLQIEENSVIGLDQGIRVAGWLPVGNVLIRQNSVYTGRSGVLISVDNAVVEANTIVGVPQESGGEVFPPREGVLIDDEVSMTAARVAGNAIRTFTCGVTVDGSVAQLDIVDNTVVDCAGGVIMQRGSTAERIRIVGNNIRTGSGSSLENDYNAGIAVTETQRVEITHNVVERLEEHFKALDLAIAVFGCEFTKIADNEIDDTGTANEGDEGAGRTAGIYVSAWFASLDIAGNRVRQNVLTGAVPNMWHALHIGGDPFSPATQTLLATTEGILIAWRRDVKRIRLARSVWQILAIRGNTLHTKARGTSIAKVMRDLPEKFSPEVRCSFVDNVCQTDAVRPDPAVLIGTVETAPLRSLVLNANQVIYPAEGKDFAIEAWMMPLYGAFTAVGNITSTNIHIDDDFLQPPWNLLNVLSND